MVNSRTMAFHFGTTRGYLIIKLVTIMILNYCHEATIEFYSDYYDSN